MENVQGLNQHRDYLLEERMWGDKKLNVFLCVSHTCEAFRPES
jgi:hypothetical protein